MAPNLCTAPARDLVFALLTLSACSDGAPPPAASAAAPVAARPAAAAAPVAQAPVVAASQSPEGEGDDPAVGGDARIADARRLAQAGDHLGAVTVLDRILAAAPDDVRALAVRGHQQLFLDGADARGRARGDLERARATAADDAGLAAAIEFNLGLLDDREGHGDRALGHFAAAHALRPSARAAAHAAGRRDCSVQVDVEAAPRDLVRTFGEAAARVAHALEADAPPPADTEDDARALLCGPTSPCPVGEPVVGVGGGFDAAYANILVPVGADRMRVVPGLLFSSREYQCTPSLHGEVVARGAWVATRATLTENEVVTHDPRGRACDPDEDPECERACFWATRRVADVFVRARDGLAVTVVASAPTPDDRAGEGRIAAYHQVDVSRTAAGVRIVGCGVDRVVPLPD